jgi:hypothetical protein
VKSKAIIKFGLAPIDVIACHAQSTIHKLVKDAQIIEQDSYIYCNYTSLIANWILHVRKNKFE